MRKTRATLFCAVRRLSGMKGGPGQQNGVLRLRRNTVPGRRERGNLGLLHLADTSRARVRLASGGLGRTYLGRAFAKRVEPG